MKINIIQPSLALNFILYGLMAGFFYAYSVNVMTGLNQSPSEEAILAMQNINIAVRNPVFFITFFLTPVLSLVLCIGMWIQGRKKPALMLAIAGLVYLLGVIVTTSTVNVPMNNELALISTPLEQGGGDAIWQAYTEKWTNWNTVRTVFCTVSLFWAGLAFRVG